jgi:hypothetical protein
MGIVYLVEQEVIDWLSINKEIFDALLKNNRLKRYRRGNEETPYYKQSDLSSLTFNDLMGPLDSEGDEGVTFDVEVDAW